MFTEEDGTTINNKIEQNFKQKKRNAKIYSIS